MSLVNKQVEGSGYVVTAKPFDGIFKAEVIDTQIGKKGATRKFVEMVYLCLDRKVVEITKDGESVELDHVRKLDIFDAEQAEELYTIGHLIEEAITPTDAEIKK